MLLVGQFTVLGLGGLKFLSLSRFVSRPVGSKVQALGTRIGAWGIEPGHPSVQMRVRCFDDSVNL